MDGRAGLPGGDEARARAIELGTQVAKALLDAPDFLRLGLMLALERRPVEPRAREMFLQVRADAFRRFSDIVRDIAPELDHESVRLITTYALAGTDGLFIAKEIGGDSVDLIKLFDLHARLVFDAAVNLLALRRRHMTTQSLGWPRRPRCCMTPRVAASRSNLSPRPTRISMWRRHTRCSGSTSTATSIRGRCYAVTRSG